MSASKSVVEVVASFGGPQPSGPPSAGALRSY